MNQRTIYYVTVNDGPSGVYKSQVIDVVHFLKSKSEVAFQIVAFISIRNFKQQKAKFKNWDPTMKVYPMPPKLKFWKATSFLAKTIGLKGKPIIARGPMAFSVANSISSNVVYDGRGAIKAELEEYPSMIPNLTIRDTIIDAEKEAVTNAVGRIAVSEQLVKYWQETYGYKDDRHMVIPCCLPKVNADKIIKKSDLGFADTLPLIVYSGGTGGWQSFESMTRLLIELLENQRINLLFLTKENSFISELTGKHPDRVKRLWLAEEEVGAYLACADYGILYRDDKITNQVASPVKFAEYLKAGLRILISSKIGDYSNLVQDENVGIVLNNKEFPPLDFVSDNERERSKALSKQFDYSHHLHSYLKVIKFLK